MAPLITILTVTRRIEALDRCIDSVQNQHYDGPLVHQLVVDGNEAITSHLAKRAKDSRIPIQWLYVSRDVHDSDGPARLAVLRNQAVELAESEYVAFLDDDNEWEPTHLHSLWSTIEEQSVDIAHSERKLFHHDGSPYLTEEFPWGRDEVSRRAIYAYCLEAGIMERGSNVVHDRMEMRFTWIDLGEWLFRREFLIANPFETRYSLWDWYNLNVEDQSLPRAIFESRLSVASTKQSTLHYFLGGYTTKFDGDGVVWRRPESPSPAGSA
jgi:glycosyltransferase involved in cell wall biosynthesis